MRLDDAIYGTICSNILSMDPLPNLSRAYAIIVQEERHINIARSKEERGDAVGLTSTTFLWGNRGGFRGRCWNLAGAEEVARLGECLTICLVA